MKKSSIKTSERASQLTQDEFAEEFQRCYSHMWVIAASIVCDRVLADDILQESALVGLKKLSQYRVGTKFDAWLSTIVRFVALNHRRKTIGRKTRSVEPEKLDLISEPSDVNFGPDDFRDHLEGKIDAEHSPFDDRVLAALKTLGETPRACLLLRAIHGLSFNEIAELLDIPLGTAMSHAHRSKTTLRQVLGDHD